MVGYIIHGLLLGLIVWMGFRFANPWNPPALFTMPTTALSVLLVTIIAPVYSDRAEGIFYLMRSQGLLTSSYIFGTTLYGFCVALVYYTLVLVGFYATYIFREPTVCNYNSTDSSCYENGRFRHPLAESSGIFFDAEYMGEFVSLTATRSPGGLGMILGIALVGSLTVPGVVMATAYLPGHRLPLVFVGFLSIMLGVYPLIHTLLRLSPDREESCLKDMDFDACEWAFNEKNATTDFLNCVGQTVYANSFSSFCVPSHASLLPQFGIFQTLSMTYFAQMKFESDPPGFVEEVLIPSIQGANCKGSTCQFPYAMKLYSLSLVYMVVGSIIMLFLGAAMASFVAFPNGTVLHMKELLSQSIGRLRCYRRSDSDESASKRAVVKELEEVAAERKTVHELVRPFVRTDGDSPTAIDCSAIDRDDVPPVIMHKLEKAYPALGGRPPKVALKSLDLHVARGQVLGFLGKNGAG
jgi:hypothetical protein